MNSFKRALVSNGSCFPSFDTPPLFHPTSSYFYFLSISHLERNQKKKGDFLFTGISKCLIQMHLSLSGTGVAPVVHFKCWLCLWSPHPSWKELGRERKSQWIKLEFHIITILEVVFNIWLSTKLSHSGESDVYYRDQNQQPFGREIFSTGQKQGPNTRAFRDGAQIQPAESHSDLVSEKRE